MPTYLFKHLLPFLNKETNISRTTDEIWNPEKNSLTLVNKWKQSLNIKQIKLIETQVDIDIF